MIAVVDISNYVSRMFFGKFGDVPTLSDQERKAFLIACFTKLQKIADYFYLLGDNHSTPDRRRESVFEYKEGRNKNELRELLIHQFEALAPYYLHGEFWQLQGYEADDLLLYVLTELKRLGEKEVSVISSDLDWAYCLSYPFVKYLIRKGRPTTRKDFLVEFGFEPTLYNLIIYKVLYGDSSDNIPPLPLYGNKPQVMESLFKVQDFIQASKWLVDNEGEHSVEGFRERLNVLLPLDIYADMNLLHRVNCLPLASMVAQVFGQLGYPEEFEIF